MEEITADLAAEFIKNTDKQLTRGSITKNAKFNASFTDMKISDVGYDKNEYKSSKPNIVKRDAVIQEILKISSAAETAIGHTIGPYADETLIQSFANDSVPIYNTRDGYTILTKMSFTQAIPQAIFKIIKETSMYLEEKIGDSTSSGIPIQNSLLSNFIDIFNSNIDGNWNYSPVGIRNISKICAKKIIEGFTNNPDYQVIFPKLAETQADYTDAQKDNMIDWLAKVATISANNDYDTGLKIAELFRNKLDGRGDVIPLVSKTEEEYTEETGAYVVYQGLIDYKKMSNTADGLTCEFEKPLIGMFDGRIRPTDLEGFKKIVETAAFGFKQPLLVIAEDYDVVIGKYLFDCLSGLQYNAKGEDLNDVNRDTSSPPHKIDIACIRLRNKETMEQFYFEDTVLMTASTPFATDLHQISDFPEEMETRMEAMKGFFGSCDKISSGYLETLFIGCKPDHIKYDRLVKELEAKLSRLKSVKFHVSDYNVGDIMQRLNRLESKTTFYHCGGRSDNVKYSRKLVVDDAVSAVKAAIKNGGVSIGGNMCVSHYIEHNIDDLVDIVLDEIGRLKINITAAENYETLKDITYIILESIQNSFGQAYRYALYNMYRDSKKAFEKWRECVELKTPSIYNIMTNMIEDFNSEDPELCTTILVPRETDSHLLEIVIETVSELINIGNMITIVSPGLDLEAIQIEQLKNGSIYAAGNSISQMH